MARCSSSSCRPRRSSSRRPLGVDAKLLLTAVLMVYCSFFAAPPSARASHEDEYVAGGWGGAPPSGGGGGGGYQSGEVGVGFNGGGASPANKKPGDVVPDGLATRVIHFSADGLIPLPKLKGVYLPNLDRLFREGVCTNDARVDPISTQTMPVHCSQLTGQFVDDHGMEIDGEKPSQQVPILRRLRNQNIFDLVQRAGMTGCMFAAKHKFDAFREAWPSIRHYYADKNGQNVVNKWKSMKGVCDYTFLHVKDADRWGHSCKGWDNKCYRDAVKEVDGFLGQVLAAGDSKTVLILTTDHAFERNGNHGPAKIPENFVVPMCVFGPGVPAGKDPYDLNPHRYKPPSDVNPDPSSSKQPVRCHDAGPLAADFLGLKPLPLPGGVRKGMINDLVVTVGGGGGPSSAGPAPVAKTTTTTTTTTKKTTTTTATTKKPVVVTTPNAAAAAQTQSTAKAVATTTKKPTTTTTTSSSTTTTATTTTKQEAVEPASNANQYRPSDYCTIKGRYNRGHVGCKSDSDCCSNRCFKKRKGRKMGLWVCVRAYRT